jgi:hypothetical protein
MAMSIEESAFAHEVFYVGLSYARKLEDMLFSLGIHSQRRAQVFISICISLSHNVEQVKQVNLASKSILLNSPLSK